MCFEPANSIETPQAFQSLLSEEWRFEELAERKNESGVVGARRGSAKVR